MGNSNYQRGLNEEKINSHYQKTLNAYKQTMNSSGSDVKDIPHRMTGGSGKQRSNSLLTGGKLMNYTEIKESLDDISSSLSASAEDPMNAKINDPVSDMNDNPPTEEPCVGPDCNNDDAILDKLNQVFTPILIMQSYETESGDQIKESLSDANVLTERNIIKFDDETRMQQLISACALLIEQNKNTPRYQSYQQAANVRNQLKLDIEKDNYEEAKIMAQKYLIKVSTTNNSSVARNAATQLMPATQH